MIRVVATAESDFDIILAALEERKVRYLVVGGVAVVLHGYARFTADLDLVIALDPANITAAMEALSSLGYRPRAPVTALEFADPGRRREWIHEKGLTVLGLWSPKHPATEVDVFVEEPFAPSSMGEALARATRAQLGVITIMVASIPDLIELKRKAGRPKDLDDIEKLQEILARDQGHV
jgi:predicted nucleotidyltransferase